VQGGGIFDELEHMVQNLGNSYSDNKVDGSKTMGYDASETQTSGCNDLNLNSILVKCEYLETLNQNLVSENSKLKQQLDNESRICQQLKIESRSNTGKLAN